MSEDILKQLADLKDVACSYRQCDAIMAEARATLLIHYLLLNVYDDEIEPIA